MQKLGSEPSVTKNTVKKEDMTKPIKDLKVPTGNSSKGSQLADSEDFLFFMLRSTAERR